MADEMILQETGPRYYDERSIYNKLVQLFGTEHDFKIEQV
jgi:hypothetical protein